MQFESNAHHAHVENKQSISDQLDRILAHELFNQSPVLSKFLRFVVEETLAGNASSLKEYTIGVNALGKKQDFNPQGDAIVRIHAGRLRRLLSEYYSGPGYEDPVLIEIIKGSYVPICRERPIVSISNNELIEQPVIHWRSKLTIAIMPFRNLCPDNSYQFFADGLGEELTACFSTFQDISVIAHHSTRKYTSPDFDMKAIGAAMGAHYLITGTVRRTDYEIRITVGLIETVNSTQVWSKSYRHTFIDNQLIEIQDHIINDIYGILGGYYGFIIRDTIISGRSKKPISIQAFDAALWNYYFHMNFSLEVYEETRKALEIALKLDPTYAVGMAMLSEIYLDAFTLGHPTVEDPLNTGYEMAKKAIEIDPKCQHAYRSYAWANVYLKKKEEALQAMEHCLELDPSSISTIGTIGFGMACIGEYKRAFELLNTSLSLNPHCPWWFYLGYYLIYYKQGDFEKALLSAKKISPPDVFFNPVTKSAAKGKLGLIKEAAIDNLELVTNFQPILKDLRMHLGAIILDDELIDDILDGVVLSGLNVKVRKYVH